jgi:hypothetical protein
MRTDKYFWHNGGEGVIDSDPSTFKGHQSVDKL